MLILLFLGVVLSASSIAIVGTFSLLQNRGLAGDAVAHALLPGLCLAFLLVGKKAVLPLLVGATLSGGLALTLIDHLPLDTKLNQEGSVALVLSSFFGFGLFLLTHIQQNGQASQAGLQQLLLGNAAILLREECFLLIGFALLLVCFLFFFFRSWKLWSFDPNFAHAIGWPVMVLHHLFRLITLSAILLGSQSIGVILISAMLMSPATTASFWSDCLKKRLLIAVFVASLGSVVGIFLSYAIAELPLGATIVLALACLLMFSLFFSPKKGWLFKKWKTHAHRQQVLQENLLKYTLLLEEKQQVIDRGYTIEALSFPALPTGRTLVAHLCQLSGQGLIEEPQAARWRLTSKGREIAKNLFGRHLLWERYLSERLKVKEEHLHNDAERAEHLISKELEKKLQKTLKKQ